MSSSSTIADRRSAFTVTLLAALGWAAARVLFVLWPDLFVAWDAKASDRLFLLRDRADCSSMPCDDTITHVDLTYTMLQSMPGGRVTRSDHARVVENLAAAGFAVQAFDYVFAAKEKEEDDAALTRAAAAAGSVYFGSAFHIGESREAPGSTRHKTPVDVWQVSFEGDPPDAIPIAFDPILTVETIAGRGSGFLNLEPDGDGVFRRAPLLLRYGNGVVPSFAFRIACDYLGVTASDVVVSPGRSIRLRNANVPGAQTRHDVVIPIDDRARVRVNFIGPWEALPHAGFRDVWRAGRDPVALEVLRQTKPGRIAMIADLSTGAADAGPVPTDGRYPLTGVHATILHNILHESFVRESRASEMLAIELTLAIAVAAVGARLGSRGIAAAAVALGVVYFVFAVAAFWRSGIILSIVRPLLGLALASAGIVVYRFIGEENARALLRQSFAAYFPPTVVDRIVRDPELVTTSGQRKELTILFSDIKSFTTRSQALSPDEVRAFLNGYFSEMVDIVFEHGGTVDKFIGDGLMVFFGDPEEQSDHAVRAVKSAMAMQVAVRRLSGEDERAGRSPLAIRIGINTGVVTVGNMGSSRRLSYTVLGANVNLAQRLESSAPVGGILIADRTAALVREEIPIISRGAIPIKGLDEPVAVFEVVLDSVE